MATTTYSIERTAFDDTAMDVLVLLKRVTATERKMFRKHVTTTVTVVARSIAFSRYASKRTVSRAYAEMEEIWEDELAF